MARTRTMPGAPRPLWLGVLGAVILAACQSAATRQQSTANRPSTAELRAACTIAAATEGFAATAFEAFRTVTGSRGIEIGASAMMTGDRGGQPSSLRCNVSFLDGIVRLTDD